MGLGIVHINALAALEGIDYPVGQRGSGGFIDRLGQPWAAVFKWVVQSWKLGGNRRNLCFTFLPVTAHFNRY